MSEIDGDKLHSALSRAARAKALMGDDLLIEGFKALEDAYITAWRETMPGQDQAREKLYIAVNVIGKLKQHLETVIANGKVAEADLKRMTEPDRKKILGLI